MILLGSKHHSSSLCKLDSFGSTNATATERKGGGERKRERRLEKWQNIKRGKSKSGCNHDIVFSEGKEVWRRERRCQMKMKMKSNEVRHRHRWVHQKDKERVNCQLLTYNERRQRPQKDFTRLSPPRQKPDTTASPCLNSQVPNLFTSSKNQTKQNKQITYTVMHTYIQIRTITSIEVRTVAHCLSLTLSPISPAAACRTWTNIKSLLYIMIKKPQVGIWEKSQIPYFNSKEGKKQWKYHI